MQIFALFTWLPTGVCAGYHQWQNNNESTYKRVNTHAFRIILKKCYVCVLQLWMEVNFSKQKEETYKRRINVLLTEYMNKHSLETTIESNNG